MEGSGRDLIYYGGIFSEWTDKNYDTALSQQSRILNRGLPAYEARVLTSRKQRSILLFPVG